MCKLHKEMFGVGAAQQETVLLVVTGHLSSPGTWRFNGSLKWQKKANFWGVQWILSSLSILLLPLHLPAAAVLEVGRCLGALCFSGTAHSACSRQSDF